MKKWRLYPTEKELRQKVRTVKKMTDVRLNKEVARIIGFRQMSKSEISKLDRWLQEDKLWKVPYTMYILQIGYQTKTLPDFINDEKSVDALKGWAKWESHYFSIWYGKQPRPFEAVLDKREAGHFRFKVTAARESRALCEVVAIAFGKETGYESDAKR